VKHLDRIRIQKKFLVLGFVVMPEHIHLLVSEPEESSLSAALQILKQEVARILLKKPKKRVPGQLMLGFAGLEKERHLWQRRFYDFNVWSESKFNEKLNYMHANPVKRGLVLHPKDWPWSSWSHYAKGKTGLLRIDRLTASGERNGPSKKRQNPHP
jgi:putative transposase